MKWIKRIFHILGGIYFAIFLIAAIALSVMIGTLLEAHTHSHLYAAQWTYHHPLFASLLGLLFINILCAALRRWPFRLRHIPFLLAHLGLLMVIGGTIFKNWYGIQGYMDILEGSANQKILIPHTLSLHLEKKASENSTPPLIRDYPLKINFPITHEDPFFPGIQWKVICYTPHVSEKIETWVKGEWAFITGLPPIPIQEWTDSEPLLIKNQARLHHSEASIWNFMAIRTEQVKEAIQSIYLQGLDVQITPREAITETTSLPLREALQHPIFLDGDEVRMTLHLSYFPIQGFKDPVLKVDWKGEVIRVALQGDQALYPVLDNPKWNMLSRLQIDLKRQPTIVFIEDLQGDCLLLALDAHGRVHTEAFRQADPHPLVVYDQGFGGYAAQTQLPFPPFPAGREEKEKADVYQLTLQLRQLMDSNPTLLPPLKLLKQACDRAQVDFASTLIDFLYLWDQHSTLLFPQQVSLPPSLIRVFQYLEWSPLSDQHACQWVSQLFERLKQPIQTGEDPFIFLEKNKWPLISHLQRLQHQKEKGTPLLPTLAQQVFSIASQLPSLERIPLPSPADQAHLLSAYLMAYGIQYHLLQPLSTDREEDFGRIKIQQDNQIQYPSHSPFTPVILETPITLKHQIEEPSDKLEDHRPRIILEIKRGQQKQMISLAYDPTGKGFKWPILHGDYTIRFQPQIREIPYRVRLRQARQIYYASSNQPYSYESDILISEEGHPPLEKTLSMNHVHETWDGYRFYLAGLSPFSEERKEVKRVQIIVNHDPAKYYFTYPGALIITLGIILLFWRRSF